MSKSILFLIVTNFCFYLNSFDRLRRVAAKLSKTSFIPSRNYRKQNPFFRNLNESTYLQRLYKAARNGDQKAAQELDGIRRDVKNSSILYRNGYGFVECQVESDIQKLNAFYASRCNCTYCETEDMR